MWRKLFYLSLIALINSLPLNSAIHTDFADSLQLVKLYDSANGNEWRHKSGWLTNESISNWYGIETDTIPDGEYELIVVKGINLPTNKLTGTLPELNLPYLENLHLQANQMTGILPHLNLPKLKVLYLSGNKFYGKIPDFNFPDLETCELSGNGFGGLLPNLSLLPSLKLLNLSNNLLKGDIPKLSFQNLESIYLSSNELTGNIPEIDCPNLKLLHLQFNSLSGSIPNLKLPNLTILNLDRNLLTGTIPNFNLPMLQDLKISANLLDGNLPIFKLPELKNLELINNKITKFPKGTLIPNIENIRLSNNLLTELPDLSGMKNLKVLKVQNNKLTFEDIEPNTSIIDFDYSDQDTLLPVELTRIGTEFILTAVANGTLNSYQWQRDDIDLEGSNEISYTGTKIGFYKCIVKNSKVPDLTLFTKTINPMKVIYALKSDSLELVRFYNEMDGNSWARKVNWLTDELILSWYGVATDTIEIDGDSLLVVKSIILGNNGISGELPQINLPYLTDLDLFFNLLTGKIPELNLPNLKNLDLSVNEFSNEIPKLNLPKVQSINISENQLTGNLPTLNLPAVEYLNLEKNSLSGKIPNLNLPKLDLLILSKNKFNTFSTDYNLPLLTEIELNNNSLTGDFPAFKSPKLRAISINNNFITGFPDLTSYKSLEELNAENNKLTFEDIVPNVFLPFFYYEGQDTVLPVQIKYSEGKFELTVIANGANNHYQWQNYGKDLHMKIMETIKVPNEGDSLPGNYRCKVTNNHAPDLTLYSETIDPTTISVELENKGIDLTLEIFPNPAKEYLIIKYSDILNLQQVSPLVPKHQFGNTRISIVNEIGNQIIILKNSQTERTESTIYFSTKTLSSGNYFVIFESGEQRKVISLKILK